MVSSDSSPDLCGALRPLQMFRYCIILTLLRDLCPCAHQMSVTRDVLRIVHTHIHKITTNRAHYLHFLKHAQLGINVSIFLPILLFYTQLWLLGKEILTNRMHKKNHEDPHCG